MTADDWVITGICLILAVQSVAIGILDTRLRRLEQERRERLFEEKIMQMAKRGEPWRGKRDG